MGIDTTDSESKQAPGFDQGHHLGLRGDLCLWEVAQETEDVAATRELAERELADHPWVSQYLGFLEERGELRISVAEVVDPDRGVNEDHADVVRRRGIALKVGSLPASWARRRALSRSISARSACRTSARSSLDPVKRWASRIRSSSRASVVLMLASRHRNHHHLMRLLVPLWLRKPIAWRNPVGPTPRHLNALICRISRGVTG